MDPTASRVSHGDFYEDAPASILTHSQREFLMGSRGDVTDSSERAMFRRIRQRIVTATWDLRLLVHAYPDEEMEKVRHEGTALTTPFAEFLYSWQPEDPLLVEEVLSDDLPSGRDPRAAWVETAVSRGIERAIGYRESVDADVETAIDVERREDLDALADEKLHTLSRHQLDTLLSTGRITPEEYGRAVERQLGRE